MSKDENNEEAVSLMLLPGFVDSLILLNGASIAIFLEKKMVTGKGRDFWNL